MVFENLIRGPGSLFKQSAVVLVTHASHFLNRVDAILLIVGGRNKYCDTWSNLLAFEASDPETRLAVEHIKASVQEVSSASDDERPNTTGAEDTKRTTDEKKDTLMTEEEREQGLSSLGTWLLWFKRAGGMYFLFFQLLFMTIDRFAYVGVEVWLAKWTSGATESVDMLGITFEPQTDGRSAQYRYLVVYSSILLVSISSTALRSEWSVTGGSRAATKVFDKMLVRGSLGSFSTVLFLRAQCQLFCSLTGERPQGTHVIL